MEEKKCKTCGKTKTLNNFGKVSRLKDGLNIYCKDCISNRGKKHYKKYKTKINERNKNNYVANKESYSKRSKKRYIEKREHILKQHAEYYKNHKKEKNEYKKKRRKDPLYNLMFKYSSRMRLVFKENDYIKNSNKYDILGCFKDEFKTHLNNNPYGFSISDKSMDMDHIVPVSSAKTEDEMKVLFHYNNYQLLPSDYNRNIKKDKPWNQTHFENWLLKNPQNTVL